MEKIILHPKKKDFELVGRELIKIEIYFSSFKVTSQRATVLYISEQFELDERIFPLKYLKEFFRVLGHTKQILCHRDPINSWALTRDS